MADRMAPLTRIANRLLPLPMHGGVVAGLAEDHRVVLVATLPVGGPAERDVGADLQVVVARLGRA